MSSPKERVLRKLRLYEKNRAGVLTDPGTFLRSLADDVRPLSPVLAAVIAAIPDGKSISPLAVDNAMVEVSLLLSGSEVASTPEEILRSTPQEQLAPVDQKRYAPPVRSLPGIGDKLAEELSKMGIRTTDDVLLHFPIRYEVLTPDAPGERKVLKGVFEAGGEFRTKKQKRMYRALFRGDRGHFSGLWLHFTRTFPSGTLVKGNTYHLYGAVTTFEGVPAIFHPEMLELADLGQIRPVYTLPAKVSDKVYQKVVSRAVTEHMGDTLDPIPRHLREKYAFPDMKDALMTVHFPRTAANVTALSNRTHPAYLRFVYEELFILQAGLLMKRQSYASVLGVAYDVRQEYLEEIKRLLPFRLTNAQRKVLVELFNDMRLPRQMNRLVQGDVGSGKTILAFIAGFIAAKNGYQTVILAPTEVLAEQHYRNLSAFLAGTGQDAVLLTGSMGAKGKRHAKELVAAGHIPFVVGTHAIIQDDVAFHKLGLAIIDEQHRFGVKQRKALMDKGYAPDIILMSATPIPRTLALSLYGDLDVSQIDEMPPGRVPVMTKWYTDHQSRQAFAFVKEQIQKGQKAYFVYPLIDESDKVEAKAATKRFEDIKAFFGEQHVGLLHGRMKAEEKRELLSRFKEGDLSILVSTTVIEVGVDVKEATVMVVENAERFGLAQLHQLRGRVGRNDMQSYCLLVTSPELSENGQERIKAMLRYTDGFKLAEIDLDLRGAGEFFGTKQSGVPEFHFANIIRDSAALTRARRDAEEIIGADPTLSDKGNAQLRSALASRWKEEFDFLFVG